MYADGASSAPALFEAFSTFLEWAIKEKAQYDRVVHYADDFMVYRLSGKGLESCHWLLETLIGKCKDFGVPLAEEKTEGPTSSLVFLGLEIDDARQLVCIPMDKLVKL